MHVIVPHMSCVVFPYEVPTAEDPTNKKNEFQIAIDLGYREIYMIAADGFYKYHRLRDGAEGKIRFIQTKVTEIPGMKKPAQLKEATDFLPDGKVPLPLFHEILAFFREIMKVKKSEVEAMAMILWSKERGYFVHIPDQKVSKASAHYDWLGLPEGASLVVDIH